MFQVSSARNHIFGNVFCSFVFDDVWYTKNRVSGTQNNDEDVDSDDNDNDENDDNDEIDDNDTKRTP